MDRGTPIWQLDDGWFQLEGGFRWARPVATAHLHRPAARQEFELKVNISPDLIHDAGGAEARVFVAGTLVGSARFTSNGWQASRWTLAPEPGGPVEIRIESTALSAVQ